MDVLAYLAIAVIAYLLGSISTGMLVSKAMGGPDLHKVGSGNTGATNALRTMGKKGGAAVFLRHFAYRFQQRRLVGITAGAGCGFTVQSEYPLCHIY